MLAIVEDFAGLGVFEGTGASAEGFAGFDQGDGVAGGFEGDGGGHSGQPASDDDRRVLRWPCDGYLERVARQAMRNFGQGGKGDAFAEDASRVVGYFSRMP